MPMEQNQNCISSFSENIHVWGKLSILGPKLMCHYNSASAVRIFFLMLNIERGQEVHQNYVNGFPEKILVWGKWVIWAQNLL